MTRSNPTRIEMFTGVLNFTADHYYFEDKVTAKFCFQQYEA